jgi:hypothetical protein
VKIHTAFNNGIIETGFLDELIRKHRQQSAYCCLSVSYIQNAEMRYIKENARGGTRRKTAKESRTGSARRSKPRDKSVRSI